MVAKRYYQVEVSHPGLNKYKVIKADSRYELQMKANALKSQWDEQWARKREQLSKEAERKARIKNEEESQRYAMDLTQQAEKTQQELERIISDRIRKHEVNPNKLKDFSGFPDARPSSLDLKEVGVEPRMTDEKYNPKPSFFTKISKRKMSEFTNQSIREYEKDHKEWEQEKNRIEAENEKSKQQYFERLLDWEKRQTEYLEAQKKVNAEVDEMIAGTQHGVTSDIERYIAILLGEIEFPFEYSIEAITEYNADNKGIIIEINLPTIEDIPKLKSVSYVKSRKEYKETYYSDSILRKKYDSVIYQIVLLCLDNVFYIGERYRIIDNVVINGRINTIDKATGKRINPCVLSLTIDRNTFKEANIDAVDPKTWFKSAKGVSAASIAGITPVAPIVSISREDKRFIEGYSVSDQLDEGVNLASIDWQDFENLIRELFEKEFSVNGGEVKITQASRDGGVDAVAFDPDPIRGGKIVIQAKRYTNVVGVSAVRDLYGTVLNEGANKGILVTTSNYGNDAYNFIKDKPLTLLNGANLLYLMEKHGYKARIDLKEAKEMLKP